MNVSLMCKWLIGLTFLVSFATVVFSQHLAEDGVWESIDRTQLRQPGIDSSGFPATYETFRLNKSALDGVLNKTPKEFSAGDTILTLPMPDGSFCRFRIEHSLVVEPGLLIDYPELRCEISRPGHR